VSHVTIIIGGKKRTVPHQNLLEETEPSGTTEVSYTYVVPHEATPEQIGAEVAKLAKKARKMLDEPAEE